MLRRQTKVAVNKLFKLALRDIKSVCIVLYIIGSVCAVYDTVAVPHNKLVKPDALRIIPCSVQ